jgi:hypothetical protein
VTFHKVCTAIFLMVQEKLHRNVAVMVRVLYWCPQLHGRLILLDKVLNLIPIVIKACSHQMRFAFYWILAVFTGIYIVTLVIRYAESIVNMPLPVNIML